MLEEDINLLYLSCTNRFLAVSSEKQASFAFVILLLEVMLLNKATPCKRHAFFH